MILQTLAALTLIMCHVNVAIFTCTTVFMHCKILELRSFARRDIDKMAHTWNVAITMTALRYILFNTQPGHIIFGASVFLGIIEAQLHDSHTMQLFSYRYGIFTALTETATVFIFAGARVHGCTILDLAFIPLRTQTLRLTGFELGLPIMASIQRMATVEIAALCTWNRTRNITYVTPLFAN